MRLRIFPPMAAGALALGAASSASLAQGQQQPSRYAGFDPVARDAWLVDCRQKIALRDSGPGAARVGMAEDQGHIEDECQAYLDAYYQRYTQGGYQPYYAQTSDTAPAPSAPEYEASRYGADYTNSGPSAADETIAFVSEEVVQPLPEARQPRPRPRPRPARRIADKRVPIR